MNDKLHEKLAGAIAKTMENITFEEVIILSNDEEVLDEGLETYWAKLNLLEPYKGAILLEIPVRLSQILAREAYGKSELDLSDSALEDMIGEILNTIAGLFLEELVPDDEIFEFGLPEKGKGTPPKLSSEAISVNWSIGEYFITTKVFGKKFTSGISVENKEHQV